ncbi:MAG: polysaccharide deacetylase family protein [Lachnospiraceae bacterium]|nr:polysaccharide deacetylase family protein [Lachnospiraceae bacterium]
MALAGCQDAEEKEEAVKSGEESQAGGQSDTGAAGTGWEPQPELETWSEAVTEQEADPQQEEELQPGQDSEEAEPGQRTVKAAERKTPPEGWELTLASEDWGLSFGEPGTTPVGNASAGDLAWYDGYYVGDGSEKVIYLTFDCGYENGNTEPILDALNKHNVKATFFVVGHFLETAPELVKRMVQEGHAVGNHTYHHLDMPSISDKGAFQKEMDDVANLFQEITGAELSPYYRPPQGKCNVQNLKMAQELGYYTIFWSLAYVDWNQDKQPSHEEAFDKLTTRVHPGAVVLLHNTSSTNGEILDELLTKWEGMGYTFKPLSELVDG